MKYLIVLLTLISSFALGEEATFQNRVYPLLKKSPIHLILFTNFDFHPTSVHEHKDDKSHSITTLVSYSPDDTGSINWTHFVTFHLTTNKDNEVLISRIDFRDTKPHTPCFIPKEVVSVDGIGNLTLHKVSIESQPLLPQAKQLFQQLRSKTKK
jgi:hypothetical protein